MIDIMCELEETVLEPLRARYWCPVCRMADYHLPLDEIARRGYPRQMQRNCVAKMKALRTKRTGPCIHQGNEIERLLCETCPSGKNVRITVFGCSVWGKCSLETQIRKGIPVCKCCPLYEAQAG